MKDIRSKKHSCVIVSNIAPLINDHFIEFYFPNYRKFLISWLENRIL